MILAKFVRNHLGIAYIMVLSISVSDQIVLAEAMQLAQTFFAVLAWRTAQLDLLTPDLY